MDDHKDHHKHRIDLETVHRLGHWVIVDLIPVLLLLAIMLWGMSLIPKAEARVTQTEINASLING